MKSGNKKKKLISIIVPCFNEESTIEVFYNEMSKIQKQMAYINFEILMIDDGSTDNTLDILKNLCRKDSKSHYISFSRNFGKEAAILAGLEASCGDFVATLDADLQDPPNLLPAMYESIKDTGFDCAATRRISRNGEPAMRSFCAKLFYRIMSKISDVQIIDGSRDFRLMTRKMVNSILSLHEYNRFSKGLYSWVGFKTKWFDYKNSRRSSGRSKWSFWRLIKYSIDGIIAFSTTPLVLASICGLLLCLISFIMICVIIAKTLFFGDPAAGYPSMMSVILFIGGIQLLFIGIVGQYVSKTYLETKHRPIYIIREKNITE